MYIDRLTCTECDSPHDAAVLQTVCTSCGRPLQALYDLDKIKRSIDPAKIGARSAGGLWRFKEVLPLRDPDAAVSLGEGGTPLLSCKQLGDALGLDSLWIKNESLNPTGSFKDRGMSLAVSMAKALGAKALAAPSAGNAGGSLAAYGARAGLPVTIAMPEDVPMANRLEAEACGARVQLIAGTIADCGHWLREQASGDAWFDVSTLKEPYRVEGKKTMGYELAEHFEWTLPDVVLYPTGGGTGLVGMWKAFDEMEALGWIPKGHRPRMIAVQAEGCAPITKAFESGADQSTPPEAPSTVASGLRVPTPIGDRWMLRILRACGGQSLAVTDAELLSAARKIARHEGVFPAPEGGALVAALEKLIANGDVQRDERVVLFVTGTGLKYLEAFQEG